MTPRPADTETRLKSHASYLPRYDFSAPRCQDSYQKNQEDHLNTAKVNETREQMKTQWSIKLGDVQKGSLKGTPQEPMIHPVRKRGSISTSIT